MPPNNPLNQQPAFPPTQQCALMEPLPLVRQLPENSEGKDFVVGDLHGCYGLLEQLLEKAQFDTACDRLFSVGDLIDRGPESFRCLQLLAEPWFYAVQGNHEMMLLEFLASDLLGNLQEDDESDFFRNGGEWIEQYYEADHHGMSDEFTACFDQLVDMPLLWVVGQGENRFHVLHGELVRIDYHRSGQIVWLDTDIDRWLNGEELSLDIQTKLYWGRSLMHSQATGRNTLMDRFGKTAGNALMERDAAELDNWDTTDQAGLSTTYCGHTPGKRPRKLLSHHCIDTGAYMTIGGSRSANKKYGLTMVDVRDQRFFRASGIGNNKWGS